MQMVGMLLNNLCYYFDINGNYIYFFDYTIDNSIVNTLLLYICSITFGFCNWHRLIITANLVNVTITAIDAVYRLPITDLQLLLSYFIVAIIFILIAVYNKFIHKNEKCNKNTRK